MPNVLFVSIAFPPKSDAECLQTAKYFHFLQEHKDLRIEVVTSAIPTLYMKYDEKLDSYAEGYTHQVAVPLRENRWLNLFRNRFKLEETVFPDVKQSFHRQSKEAIKKIKQTPDVIYSRSYPLSSAIMAYKLQQHFKVPWIMHLSDPWADSPLHNWSSGYNSRQKEWELKTMEAARYVCLTSLSTIDFYRRKYPHLRDKFLFYPNVYEMKETKEEFPYLDKFFPEKKLAIVFTGAMAADRSPSFFLEPLRQLITEQPQLSDKVTVVFAGEADFKNRSVFEKYAMPSVHYLGKLPFSEALYLQRRADMLLLIDNPIEDPKQAMYFPSKLLDYMVTQKRIMAITTKGSATDIVMKDLKGDVLGHKNVNEIKDVIKKTVCKFGDGDSDYFLNPSIPQKYEAKYNADRLAQLIKDVVDA
jgi:hypothetical protein